MEYYLVLLLPLPQGFVMMLAESVHMPTRGLFTLADAIVVQSSEELVRCPLSPHMESHGALHHAMRARRPREQHYGHHHTNTFLQELVGLIVGHASEKKILKTLSDLVVIVLYKRKKYKSFKNPQHSDDSPCWNPLLYNAFNSLPYKVSWYMTDWH